MSAICDFFDHILAWWISIMITADTLCVINWWFFIDYNALLQFEKIAINNKKEKTRKNDAK